MVQYLLKRPIAVFMISIALVFLGLVATKRIPTSLLPKISIPKITVFVSYPNQSAREIETNVVRKLRNQLLQVSHLKDIQSNSFDGQAVINLTFNYGTNTDYAFIETNEKIDAIIGNLPKDLDRPKVIKASASDIPILNLTLSLKNENNTTDFLQLTDFAQNVIKNRLEQLPEIALADMSGFINPQIVIIPDKDKLIALNITDDQIIKAIQDSNFEFSNLIIQNGIYQYNFKLGSPLQNKNDIEKIFINSNNHLLQIKDIAQVKYQSEIIKGMVKDNGKRAIVFSIIKQADAQVSSLKIKLDELIKQFISDYPNLEFKVNQDQSKLLQVTLNNLKQSLIAGSLLAILILFLFLKDVKSPLIIGFSIPLSLVISILLMYLFGMSINIISLSGLILGVGMMIDNSIIVIDNITQKIESGLSLQNAISKGTTEIIAPLFTSVLTTVSVFLPLVFLSGITGALFLDQALSVTIGLGVSLLVSIIIIPVIYQFLHQRKWKIDKFTSSSKIIKIENWYKKGYAVFFERKKITLAIAVAGILLSILFFKILPYKKMPDLKPNDMLLEIDFNQNITVQETAKRVDSMLKSIQPKKSFIQIGEQQYLLNQQKTKRTSEAEIYLQANSSKQITQFKNIIDKKIKNIFPEAKFSFSNTKNVFEQIFGDAQSFLIAKIYNTKNLEVPKVEQLLEINTTFKVKTDAIPLKNTVVLEVIFENVLLYNVDYQKLINQLKTFFNQNAIGNLKSSQKFIPIKLASEQRNLNQIINSNFIVNSKGKAIPLRNLIKIKQQITYKSIYADKYGEYLPFTITQNQFQYWKENNKYNVKFSGSKYEMQALSKELLGVVIISVLLLYFIMAAQFESLWQPIIILLEIPIDIGAGLLLVWLFNGSINVMTIIGIVVMSGIIINDSILKIHTINQLRKNGLSLRKAVEQAGKLRLKPIIMTTLTTTLALLPFLFLDGMGSALQKPLALVVIGGLVLGTFISLYFVPIMYFLVSKKN